MLTRKLQKSSFGAAGDPILDDDHPNRVVRATMDNIVTTTLVDESPNGNDGTISGATAVAGSIGNALSFDGTNDKVNFTASPFLLNVGAFSFRMKVPSGATGTRRAFCVGRSTANTGYSYLAMTDAFTGNYRTHYASQNAAGSDSNRNFYGSTVLSVDTYYHFVFQSDGSTLEVYVDGVLQSLTESAAQSNDGRFIGEAPASGGPKNLAALGCLDRSSPVFSAQDVDEFEAFDRVLTLTEIEALRDRT